MPKSTGQKLRILWVQKILREKTDADHLISIAQIQKELETRFDMNADRKSIMDDLSQLESFGLAIEKRSGTGGGYALVEKEFQLEELQLLIDMVQSSNFITEKKSRVIIDRFSEFCSEREMHALKRHVCIADRPKNDNESIFYEMNAINGAINGGMQVSFLYFDYDRDKNKIFRHNQKRYVVSPWELTVDDGKYYLVAYDPERGKITCYRVDKMAQTRIEEDKPCETEHFKNVDNPVIYIRGMFGMFTGDLETVTLRVKNDMAHVIFDRFGLDSITVLSDPASPDWFRCAVRVIPSRKFFSWISATCGDIRIVSPKKTVDDYRAFILCNAELLDDHE